MGLNRFQGIGNLGKDPENRVTQTGTSVCSFSIGCNESYKDNAGEWKTRTEWVKIVAWGNRADAVAEHCRIGDKLYVEGKLQTRAWEDRDGNKRYTTEVVASVVEWFAGKGKSEGPDPDKYGSALPEDDVPF